MTQYIDHRGVETGGADMLFRYMWEGAFLARLRPPLILLVSPRAPKSKVSLTAPPTPPDRFQCNLIGWCHHCQSHALPSE